MPPNPTRGVGLDFDAGFQPAANFAPSPLGPQLVPPPMGQQFMSTPMPQASAHYYGTQAMQPQAMNGQLGMQPPGAALGHALHAGPLRSFGSGTRHAL